MVCRSDKVQRLSLPLITINELQILSYVELSVNFSFKSIALVEIFRLFIILFTKFYQIEIIILIMINEYKKL